MPSPAAPFPVALRALVLLWLFCALAAGKLQLLAQIPAPALPAITLGLAGLLLLAYHAAPPLRSWIDRLDLRALVAFHLTRFVGFYLLHHEAHDRLPPVFFEAGVGDIVVAGSALALILIPLTPPVRLRAITIWNVVGLMNLLFVVASVGRLAVTDPASLRAFMHLPLCLLPTFLMPLTITTHVIIFLRISRERGGVASSEG